LELASSNRIRSRHGSLSDIWAAGWPTRPQRSRTVGIAPAVRRAGLTDRFGHGDRHPRLHGPEHASGDTVDAGADVYALGCVLYTMLTGGPPFTGDSPSALAWQHPTPPVPVASHRSPIQHELDALVGQQLAKHPAGADRPGAAGEVRAKLMRLLAQPATPPPWPVP